MTPMTFTHFVFALILAFAAAVSASPLAARDVFVPPVTYPHAGTVWYVGQRHNVTWDISQAPVNITNKIGTIRFRFSGIETPLILASGFNILDARTEITVPWVDPRTDYSLVLFGDSGNFSPNFEIRS